MTKYARISFVFSDGLHTNIYVSQEPKPHTSHFFDDITACYITLYPEHTNQTTPFWWSWAGVCCCLTSGFKLISPFLPQRSLCPNYIKQYISHRMKESAGARLLIWFIQYRSSLILSPKCNFQIHKHVGFFFKKNIHGFRGYLRWRKGDVCGFACFIRRKCSCPTQTYSHPQWEDTFSSTAEAC